jgi:hypothetical protein
MSTNYLCDKCNVGMPSNVPLVKQVQASVVCTSGPNQGLTKTFLVQVAVLPLDENFSDMCEDCSQDAIDQVLELNEGYNWIGTEEQTEQMKALKYYGHYFEV